MRLEIEYPQLATHLSTEHNKSSNTIAVSSNIANNIPKIFNNSDNSLSDTLSPSTLENPETAAPRRFTRSGANQVNYKKFFQRRKAAAIKTNSLVQLNLSNFKTSHILFDYALNH